MEYPYSWVPEYGVPNIQRPLLVEADIADAGSFPETIQSHLWIRPGQKEGDDWKAIGQLTNGAYFFYRGGCDYTGFDCQGGMDLWVTYNWQNLLDYVLDEETFRLFQEQTDAE